jgi:hypothetical protein
MVNPEHAFQSFKAYFLCCETNEMKNDELKSLENKLM